MSRLSVMQPPVSILIIGICVVIFLLQNLSPALALWPLQSGYFEPWQVITYGFLHGGFNHIFFNMFALWMFGSLIELDWGSRRFVSYYFACVIGAALVQLLVTSSGDGAIYPTVGASGGVFGILLAFGLRFPNQYILLLIPPIPIKAKWFVIIYGAIELYLGITGTQAGVAHFAHLGGMFAGLIMILYWRGKLPLQPRQRMR